MDALKDLDFTKFVLFVVPGALFALSRSFTLRGVFPTVVKDDIAAFVVSSCIYHFLLITIVSATFFNSLPQDGASADKFAFAITIVFPTLLGIFFGVAEAGDWVGKIVRRSGFNFRSPTQTAWETLFSELRSGSFLLITLKDGSLVCGRWIKGSRLSAASTDASTMDIFVAEIGSLNAARKYLPNSPQRGIYISAGEIRSIEVV